MRRFAFCMLALMIALSACGKRASMMEAPEGTNAGAYPRHYPDTVLDPQGTYVPPEKK